jgi:hypothetical protein
MGRYEGGLLKVKHKSVVHSNNFFERWFSTKIIHHKNNPNSFSGLKASISLCTAVLIFFSAAFNSVEILSENCCAMLSSFVGSLAKKLFELIKFFTH